MKTTEEIQKLHQEFDDLDVKIQTDIKRREAIRAELAVISEEASQDDPPEVSVFEIAIPRKAEKTYPPFVKPGVGVQLTSYIYEGKIPWYSFPYEEAKVDGVATGPTRLIIRIWRDSKDYWKAYLSFGPLTLHPPPQKDLASMITAMEVSLNLFDTQLWAFVHNGNRSNNG